MLSCRTLLILSPAPATVPLLDDGWIDEVLCQDASSSADDWERPDGLVLRDGGRTSDDALGDILEQRSHHGRLLLGRQHR